MRSYRSFLLFSFILIFILTLPGAVTAGGDSSLTVAGFDSGKMEKGAPSGWELVEKKGAVNLVLERVDDRYALHMKSDRKSSFGIKKEMDVKIKEY
ncbi:MAG: hypothetical protein JRC53_04580, partial [Deltaproteobacteria bacterium]|nr:hypothetical protein [Deltaproteobacteria bacterium]